MNPRKKRTCRDVCISLSVAIVAGGMITSMILLPSGWDLAIVVMVPVEMLFGTVLVMGFKAAFEERRFMDGYMDLMTYLSAAGIAIIEMALTILFVGLASIGLSSLLKRGRRRYRRGSSSHREMFRMADEQRAISEDIEQWGNTTPRFKVTDHFDWFDELCAKSDGYID